MLVTAFFWLCGRLHAGAAQLCSWVGSGGAWLLRPFPWSCRFGALATVMALLALWLGFYGGGPPARSASRTTIRAHAAGRPARSVRNTSAFSRSRGQK